MSMNQLVKRLKKAQQQKMQQTQDSSKGNGDAQPTFNIYVDEQAIEAASQQPSSDLSSRGKHGQRDEKNETGTTDDPRNNLSEEDIAAIVDRTVEQKYAKSDDAPSYSDIESIAQRVVERNAMDTTPAITPDDVERIVEHVFDKKADRIAQQPKQQTHSSSAHTNRPVSTGRSENSSITQSFSSSSDRTTSRSTDTKNTFTPRPADLPTTPASEKAPATSFDNTSSAEPTFTETPEMDQPEPSPSLPGEGMRIPQEQQMDHGQLEEEEDDSSLQNIDIQYPLIPQDADSQEEAYAWAHITYDKNEDALVYRVNEPPLPEPLEEKLQSVEEILKESLDVSLDDLKKDEAKRFLTEKVAEVIDTHHFDITQKERDIIEYYAYRNFIGLGKIEPFMNDKNIEDISCDGYNISMYVYHRHPKIGSLKTNVVFEDESELDAFVIKLSQRCGRTVSVAEPLLDGSLPDGSRVQATLGTDIARRGSNFTIRRFTDEPLTPIHLTNFGTINPTMLAYLWLAIEHGKSVLISGPTASGKTSMLNALSLFIQPEMKIISIEDTPELRLPHPNWVPEVSRSGFGFGATQSGEVTLDDLLKESLRQRPDYIIVGEVRGEEAYILFQQIATGHPGMSTIHASSLDKVVDRLTTDPINLSPTLLENLDIMLIMKTVRHKDTYIRRVGQVLEVEDFDNETAEPHVNTVFSWQARDDYFSIGANSDILSSLTEETGKTQEEIQQELVARREVLQWMQDQGIRSYAKVGKIIQLYYSDPVGLLQFVQQR